MRFVLAFLLALFAAPAIAEWSGPPTSPMIVNGLGFVPAASGANSDITALSGLTTALTEAQGGTGTTLGVEGTMFPATGGSASRNSADRAADFMNLREQFGNGSPSSTDVQPSANALITYLNSEGGGTGNIPSGVWLANNSITLQKAAHLAGQCLTIASSTPSLACSLLRANTTLTNLITLPTTLATHSMGLRDLVMDGNNNTTGAILSWGPILSFVERVNFTQGGGNGVDHLVSSGQTPWTDWYVEDEFTNNVGVGLNMQGSDSWIVASNFSTNNVGAILNTTGLATFLGNEIQVNTTDGVVIQNRLSIGYPGVSIPVVGNEFNQNGTSDIHVKVGAGSANSFDSAIVGNVFHNSTGILFDSGVSNGVLAGLAFSSMTGSSDITFTDSTNTGFQIIGTSHSSGCSSRFGTLPADTLVVSGGAGGQCNRLQTLILNSNTGNNIGLVADTSLNVYGGRSAFGYTGTVLAEFALQRSGATNAAFLIGSSSSGTKPFIAAVNGSGQTNLAEFDINYGTNTAIAITAPTVTFNIPPSPPQSSVSNLSSKFPSPSIGMMVIIIDQTSACPSSGATFTGGGSFKCLGIYNGTSWVKS